MTDRGPDRDRSTTLNVKAVPGARRTEVVGWLGPRLKVRVAAPPEDGRANRAICDLIAAELKVKPSCVTVAQGHGRAEKTLQLEGVSQDAVAQRWPREPGSGDR